MTEIVCYTGGTCGDLLVALIDSTDAKFYSKAVMHANQRMRLKKPHMFNNDTEKDEYVDEIGKKYLSIPSHDLDYHINKKHKFIGITVSDKKIAYWAATRFKQLHRSIVWKSMSESCGANTVDDYAQILIDYSGLISQHTDRLIRLEDIINGDAILILKKLGFQNCSENFYKNWLALQHGMFMA